MAELLNLVPQYLPRYGMAPDWARATRPLVLLFTGINLFVTWIFSASVDAQGAAYATGVIVLMSSAATATIIETYRSRTGHWIWRVPWGYSLIGLLFFYTMVAIIIEKPQGMQIASFFIVAIIVTSIISRTWRSTELRFTGFDFKDDNDKFRVGQPAASGDCDPGASPAWQAGPDREGAEHPGGAPPAAARADRVCGGLAGDVSEFYPAPDDRRDAAGGADRPADYELLVDSARPRGGGAGDVEERAAAGDSLWLVE